MFADLDNDGDYDLFSGTTWQFNNLGVGDHDNVFENDGNGFFTDVTAGDILATVRETGGVTAFDWDGDGDLDLFAAGGQAGEASEAYRNDGGLVFTSWAGGDLTTVLADESIVTDTDYDGDGDIDLLAADKSGTLVILNNNGSGVFTQVAPASLGLPGPGTFQVQDGITLADVDNDGDLDLLVCVE